MNQFVEASMAGLILASVFMGIVFIVSQRQGKNFIASFDKAIVWGSSFFVFECCLSTVGYVV